MKERPILFSGTMVRALLAGTKTQTRRVCKPAPIADARFVGGHYFPGKRNGAADISVEAPYVGLACPYGRPGDQLWVRETYFAFGRWETRFSPKKGRDEWHFVDMTIECGHAYAFEPPAGWKKPRRGDGVLPRWWRRPAIFMPRVASRITLELTEVRVQRLQNISADDARAEGIGEFIGGWACLTDDNPQQAGETPQEGYRHLWESINSPGSWAANPWIWVVEFKSESVSSGPDVVR